MILKRVVETRSGSGFFGVRHDWSLKNCIENLRHIETSFFENYLFENLPDLKMQITACVSILFHKSILFEIFY